MKRSGIYVITSLIDDKVYVGSALNLNKRFSEHKTRLLFNTHHNSLLQRAYNKYGKKNFVFTVIKYTDDKNKIYDEETELIALYKAADRNYGFNFCEIAGSGLGSKRSEETKAKMSKAQKGKSISENHKLKISQTLTGRKLGKDSHLKGKKLSIETKIKMSESHKRRFNNTKEKEKMSKAANARWSKREPLILTKAPLTLTQKDIT